MSITEAVVTCLSICVVCGIPLMAIAIRIGLRPLVEAYARIRGMHLENGAYLMLARRVEQLERAMALHGLPLPEADGVSPRLDRDRL